MEEIDQVNPDVETPADDAPVLDAPGDTQGDAPVSPPSEDAGATAEPSAPSVDEQDERIATLETERDKAREFGRTMESRAHSAENRLRPFEEKEAAVVAERMTNDTVFQARCDDIGYAKAHAEVAAAAARQVMSERDFATQGQIAQEKDNEVYNKMRVEWDKSGRSAAEFEPFMREQNGFAGVTRRVAMDNFTLLLGGKEALKVDSQTQESDARRAETRANRMAVNQPVRGEAATGVAPVPASPGDKLLAGLEKAQAQMASGEDI